MGGVPKDYNDTLSMTPTVSCRVIGIGTFGCSVVLAWSSASNRAKDHQAERACITMGEQNSWVVSETCRQNPGIAPIRMLQLGQFGSGGNVEIARAAAHLYDRELRSLIDGAELVILAAAMGGSGTGPGLTPHLARIARNASALTLAVVVTGFDWEHPRPVQAIKHLRRESHALISLSNQTLGSSFGDFATLDDVFSKQTQIGRNCVSRLLADGIRLCIDRRRQA